MEKNPKNLNEENEEFEEEIVSEEDLENQTGIVKKIRQKLKKCEQEKQEYLEGWQRTKADFVNNQKQNEKEKEEFIKFATQNLISELLPSLDNFKSALETQITESTSTEWRKGVENTYKEFKKILSQNGLEEINPEPHSKFDPNLHDAVNLEEVNDQEEDGKVTAVMQKGFKLNGRVIRAAKVKVGEYKENLKK